MPFLRIAATLLVGLGLGSSAWGQANWQPTDFLSGARHSHTATLLPNGKVLVAGGWSSNSLVTCELFDPATGFFEDTGRLVVPRLGHTATLLPSGKVLVVGGNSYNPNFYLRNVEIYDPTTGIWTPTGNLLNHGRDRHSATLLPSGKVLVVGGRSGNSSYRGTAEIFDPVTETWAATGSMTIGRHKHTATLLPSGKVLVVGGENASGPLASAELFDPATGLWSTVAPLATARYRHTAVLLPSGQVLVAAGAVGLDGSAVVTSATAEIYDPTVNTWTSAANLTSARYRHAATLLPSGQVLVTGGEDGGIPNEGNAVPESEMFDPQAGTWTAAGNMVVPRYRHTVTLLPSGQILAVGGRDEPIWALPDAEIFDNSVGAWSFTGEPLVRRYRHTATALPGGKVLMTAGMNTQDVEDFFASAEIYDEATGTWQATGSMTHGRREHTATRLRNGKVLVVGGLVVDSAVTSSAELYDPVSGTWDSAGNLAVPRFRHSATLLPSGKVLIVGGRPEPTTSTSTVELYDPDSNSWRTLPSLENERYWPTATLLLSGEVLIAGGMHSGSSLSSCEIFDPATETWRNAAPLLAPRRSHTATLLPSGKVLAVAGLHGHELTSAELYDPENDSWQFTGSLTEGRESHLAALLPGGKVLVVAGVKGNGTPNPPPLATAEIYDPATGLWSPTASVLQAQGLPALTVLESGKILLSAGYSHRVAQLFDFVPPAESLPAPTIDSVSSLAFGENFVVQGSQVGARLELGGGNFQSSAAGYPLLQLRSLQGDRYHWLTPTRPNLWDESGTLTVEHLPADLEPGPYLASLIRAGVRSAPFPVELECSVAIRNQPQSQVVAIGQPATFTVVAEGARRFQWLRDGIAIPGATFPSYSTPPVTPADAEAAFTVEVDSLCARTTSNEAFLNIGDASVPSGSMVSPKGGEYWALSTGSVPNEALIAWSVIDNVRVCAVEIALVYSTDGGLTWTEAPAGGNLPATLGEGPGCRYPGLQASSHIYLVPTLPPSGQVGSLYKIRLRAIDQAGNDTQIESDQPFFIVQPNPDSVKTLILHNLDRMVSHQGIGPGEKTALASQLRNLADHPRVQGRLINLGLPAGLAAAFEALDLDPGNADKANDVVLALRQYLREEVFPIYSGVESLVLVGDDRIVPMARIRDFTALPESVYVHPLLGGLTETSAVGKALGQNFYLSDDPLAVKGSLVLPLRPVDFANGRFLPDFAVGRLVEDPNEIIRTIATFLSQDGILDLDTLTGTGNRKVLVTGYDFLVDSANRIRGGWLRAFGLSPDLPANTPVDGELIGDDWGGTLEERRQLLFQKLGGGGATGYAVNNLNGHATHYEEGVPSNLSGLIEGLPAHWLYGDSPCTNTGPGADMAGTLVYAVGCHGGLPVPGSCANDADHSLDLPQTMMARGVVAYLANSGYGWGLNNAVGLSERLLEIFSEELRAGSTVTVGKAYVRSKLRYFLEQPGFSFYDEKTLLQWTYYGLPMYALRTGVIPTRNPALPDWDQNAPATQATTADLGGVTVNVGEPANLIPPDFVEVVTLNFNISANGVYAKWDVDGNQLDMEVEGCPHPGGCYYTLNGLSTGTPNLPVQPYFVYDSRKSGTSQHGALWNGGAYEEEGGWVSVIAELESNGGDYSDYGSTPRLTHPPLIPTTRPTDPTEACRPADSDLSSMSIITGEALKSDPDGDFDRQRIFRSLDIEAFYFNDGGLGANCDRQGPTITEPDAGFHQVQGSRIDWTVPATDAGGVWRVVVVYDGGPDVEGSGLWSPVELVEGPDGVWRGHTIAAGLARLAYVIQAVDRRGNVSWMEFEAERIPSSGHQPDLARIFDVELDDAVTDLALALTASPATLRVGDNVHFQVAVANLSGQNANGIEMTLLLPRQVTYLSGGGDGVWVCQANAARNRIACTSDTLAANSTSVLHIFGHAVDVLGFGSSTATVFSFEADPAVENNVATAGVEVTEPSLIFQDGFESGNLAAWSTVP